jgi:hypothetical protein
MDDDLRFCGATWDSVLSQRSAARLSKDTAKDEVGPMGVNENRCGIEASSEIRASNFGAFCAKIGGGSAEAGKAEAVHNLSYADD